MSEEIIIDGVDVSECEHINCCDKKIKCVILQEDVCEIKPYCEGYDCYYKQLQRLQAENERLKATHLQLQSSELKQHLEKVNFERENYKLRKENEELKAKFNNNSLCNRIQIYEADEARMRKVLEEIRGICSNTCEKNKDCIHSCYECKSIDEPVAINRILNKISEVLDER